MEIPLTKGKLAIVDRKFSHLLNYKWCYGGSGYATKYFKKSKLKYGMMLLHHCIIGQPLNGKQIDHINGDRLDNRQINLRIVDSRENNTNSLKRRDGKTSSKYVGVHRVPCGWISRITKDGKRKYLGLFKNQEDAHWAYSRELGISS